MELQYTDYETLYQGKTIDGPIPLRGVPWDIAEPQPAITGLTYRGEVLDVGCGLGDNAAFVAAQGLAVTAVDGSPTAIAHAQQRFPDSGVRFAVADAIELPGFTARFDTVLSCALLHCLRPDDRIAHLEALRRATRPDAVLHLVTFSDRELDGLRSPMALSEEDVRKPLAASGWRVEDLTESALLGAGETMTPLFDTQGQPPRRRPRLASWTVRAVRE
jgi:SAM-dependent methyltransferase